MPPSNSCQTAQSSLATTKALQLEFATAYALASKTRDQADVERARELKMSIDAAVLEFAEANKTLTVPKLVPNIFANWPSCLETIRVTELDKEFTRISLEIGGKDEYELEELLGRNGHQIDARVGSMMEHDDFKRSLRIPDPREPDYTRWQLKPKEAIKLIRFSVADLGFPSGARTHQIYARAKALGLELCPAEVGPQFRLQYTNQPMSEIVYVGMKQIAPAIEDPCVFSVARHYNGSFVNYGWAEPVGMWSPDTEFLFRLPKNT